jgi:hypothetical protein
MADKTEGSESKQGDGPPLFENAKLKIERANKHIVDLNKRLIGFLDSDFYRLVIEEDPQTGGSLAYYEVIEPVPTDIPLILGDAIHNARSALDVMAYEIACMAKIPLKDRKWIRFPFAESREKLKTALNGGHIQRAGAHIIDTIVNVVQPYKGGDDALYALLDFDIMDKHELLIPAFTSLTIRGITVENKREIIPVRTIHLHGHFPKRQRLRIESISGRNLQINDKGKPTARIVFRHGHRFEGEPVIPTLHQLTQLVFGIIGIFEEAVTKRSRGGHTIPP